MTGSIAEVLGIGLKAGAILMIARPLGRLARAAATDSGMMMNAMVIDVDVRITHGSICARDAGTRRVARPTASIAQSARWFGAAGNQGLKKSGTPSVPSVVFDVSANGAFGNARRDVLYVRPRGQRPGASGSATGRADAGGRRIGPPGRSLRQRPNETSPRIRPA